MTDNYAKVTLNLYEEDVETLRRRFGWGWSTEVRLIVRRRLQELEARDNQMRGVASDGQ